MHGNESEIQERNNQMNEDETTKLAGICHRICGIVGTVLIPYRCHWRTYLCFCCLHSTASHQWRRPASDQKNVHWVDGSAVHKGWLKGETQSCDEHHTLTITLFTLPTYRHRLKFILLTSVDDCLPLVELALVGHWVEVTTLDVSEGGQLMRTRFGVADLVPPSLSQTILPSVLRTVG